MNLAIITKDKPRFVFAQFLGLIKESDEFSSILVDREDNRFFNIINVYSDEDVNGLQNGKNYVAICDGLYMDKRTIPTYLAPWELKNLKDILITYLSIAYEDLRAY